MLLGEGPAPVLALPDPLGDLVAEIAALWSLPIGQKAQVTLKHAAFYELSGRLELVAAPALPLNPREPLRLRIKEIEFLSTQIVGWVRLE
jgi:hypothetical protein